MFDYVNIDGTDRDISNCAQVKLWDNTMHLYQFDDSVPTVKDSSTYSIMLREGGYLNIEDEILLGKTHCPQFHPVFDKYGNEAHSESYGKNDPFKSTRR